MEFIEKKALTFDDVIMIPRFNKIKSRKDVSLLTRFTKNHNIEAPIVSANMDTVTEHLMMCEMRKLGGIGIMHRFMTPEEAMRNIDNYYISAEDGIVHDSLCAVSIGVGSDSDELLSIYKRMNVDIICIDVAHGHCEQVISMIKKLKDETRADVIAGNVCTREGTRDLIEAGADAIKVGIGPGSLCTTRRVTGCGLPQFDAIVRCAEVAYEYDVPVIGDGGIRYSGDAAKALAAGAETVMMGSYFAGTEETPGEVIECDTLLRSSKRKSYRGMASRQAMGDWKGTYHASPEGEDRLVPYKGPVENIANEFLGGIRSAMTYNNAPTLSDLRNNAIFQVVSNSTIIENSAHGKVEK